jgi:hypothetical protein
MAKHGRHQPDEKSAKTKEVQARSAEGGKTRIAKPGSGRSGSQSNKGG